MGFSGTVTSKGQTTIPKEVRNQLKLKAGDKVYWSVAGGMAILRARTGSVLDIAGMFHDPHRKPLTDDALEEAIGESMAEPTRTSSRKRE